MPHVIRDDRRPGRPRRTKTGGEARTRTFRVYVSKPRMFFPLSG